MMDNVAIHVVSTIVQNLMSLEARSNIVSLYLNAKDAVVIWNNLEEMGHPQTETPLQTDNSTAEIISNRNIFQRCSEAMDMNFILCTVGRTKNTLKFIDNPAHKIQGTVTQNTTRHRIIALYMISTYIERQINPRADNPVRVF